MARLVALVLVLVLAAAVVVAAHDTDTAAHGDTSRLPSFHAHRRRRPSPPPAPPGPTEPHDVPLPPLDDTLAPLLAKVAQQVGAPTHYRHMGHLLKSLGFEYGVRMGADGYGDDTAAFLNNWSTFANFTIIFTEAQGWLVPHNKERIEPKHKGRVTYIALRDKAPKLGLQQFKDHSLDYVHISGLMDYCRVTEDLHDFWPKLRPGGIIGGSLFYDARDPELWARYRIDATICADWTEHLRGMKGAVQDFIILKNKAVSSLHVLADDKSYWLQKLKD